MPGCGRTGFYLARERGFVGMGMQIVRMNQPPQSGGAHSTQFSYAHRLLRPQAGSYGIEATVGARLRAIHLSFNNPSSAENGRWVAASFLGDVSPEPCSSTMRRCSLSWQKRHKSSQLLPLGGLLS